MLYQGAKGQAPKSIAEIAAALAVEESTLHDYARRLKAQGRSGVCRTMEDFKQRNVTRLAIKHYESIRKGK